MTDQTHPGDHSCCSDFSRARVSRRSVLQGAAAVGGGMAVTQMFGDAMMQATFAGTPGGNTMVVISLRGGIDGLGLVVPHGDPAYYAARPTTAVPVASLICKDAMFGLHPAMAPLEPLWKSGELAAIQATGLAVPNRSHFSAIEEVEDAAPGSDARTGWINRMIGLGPRNGTLDAVQLGMNFPTTALVGPNSTLATQNLNGLLVPGATDRASQRYGSLQAAWGSATGPLASGAREAVAISKGPGAKLKAMADLDGGLPDRVERDPVRRAAEERGQADPRRPGHRRDRDRRRQLGPAHRLRHDPVGHHAEQHLAASPRPSPRSSTTSAPCGSKVTVVTISEFGRRVAENGSQGFDHGWGNMMLVAGAGVKGGKYYGSWPGLGDHLPGRRRPQGDHRLPQRARRDRQQAVPGPFPPGAVPRPRDRPSGVMA